MDINSLSIAGKRRSASSQETLAEQPGEDVNTDQENSDEVASDADADDSGEFLVEMTDIQQKEPVSKVPRRPKLSGDTAYRPSLLTRIMCCCCFLSCCYRDPKRRKHCCSKWCFHARQAAFDFFVSLLLFLFCLGAFIAYTVFIGRSTEQGTAFLRFVNVTYVQETFVGTQADGIAFQLRVWAVNLIISRTATISLLAIAIFFAIINLIRRVMMCPETRQWSTLILAILLLACITVAAILVSYEQADSREQLLQKTDVLARQLDIYSDWMGLVESERAPAMPSPAAPALAPTHAPGSAEDALRMAAGDFVNTLLYKLPESVRVYAFFVAIVILSFINIFR